MTDLLLILAGLAAGLCAGVLLACYRLPGGLVSNARAVIQRGGGPGEEGTR